MTTHGQLRGYMFGLVALMVALAVTGYFLAGRTLGNPTPQLPRTSVTLSGSRGPVELPVVKVNNPGQFALAHRRTLGEGEGILYRFPGVQDDSWTGRGFRQPVSVAFLDGKGTVLRIVNIEPCDQPESARCPAYAPGVAYRMALEVNRDWFARQGVGVGNYVRVPQMGQ